MAREEGCLAEIFALADIAGRWVGVPLAQLRIVKVNRRTREVMEVSHYWVARLRILRRLLWGSDGRRLDGASGIAYR
jgi:hypothetical protein